MAWIIPWFCIMILYSNFDCINHSTITLIKICIKIYISKTLRGREWGGAKLERKKIQTYSFSSLMLQRKWWILGWRSVILLRTSSIERFPIFYSLENRREGKMHDLSLSFVTFVFPISFRKNKSSAMGKVWNQRCLNFMYKRYIYISIVSVLHIFKKEKWKHKLINKK